jgi:hypothetical protein
MAGTPDNQKTSGALASAAEYCWEAVESIVGALRELKGIDGIEDLVQELQGVRDQCARDAKQCEARAEGRHLS